LAGPAAAYALEALKSLVYTIAVAVRQWPTEARRASLFKIHSAQLRVLNNATMTVPLEYDQSSNIDRMPAPLPELLDGLNDRHGRKERKHAAQCMVYTTLALPSTGFKFWEDLGYEEEQFQEEGLKLKRGRALAVHCLLCAKGFEPCTIAGHLSGTAFLDGASQLACVQLEGAERYQVTVESVRPLAARDASQAYRWHVRLLHLIKICSSALDSLVQLSKSFQ
jgi:hypothetical protein